MLLVIVTGIIVIAGNILGQSISEHIDRRMGETDHPEILMREEVNDRV